MTDKQRSDTTKHSSSPFRTNHAEPTHIKDILVVSSFGSRCHGIGLQPNKSDIERCSDTDSDRATGHTGQGLGEEVDGLAAIHLNELVGKGPMKPDTGRPVYHLPTNSSVDTLVDTAETLFAHHLAEQSWEGRDWLAWI